MNGLKKRLFDGQRLRVDRVHPAIAIGFVLCVMFGQRAAVEGIKSGVTPVTKVAGTIDVASKPSPLAKKLDTKGAERVWTAALH